MGTAMAPCGACSVPGIRAGTASTVAITSVRGTPSSAAPCGTTTLMARRHTALTSLGPDVLYVITGPPAAGKSSWIEARARPTDVVIDLDRITAALSGPGA